MRKELRDYLEENGVKQNHVARVLGVSGAMISRYLNHGKDFGEVKEMELREFLDSKK